MVDVKFDNENDFYMIIWLDDDDKKRTDFVNITRLTDSLIFFTDRFSKKFVIPVSRILKLKEAIEKK